jgi:hypothetical protein
MRSAAHSSGPGVLVLDLFGMTPPFENVTQIIGKVFDSIAVVADLLFF